MRRVVIAIGAVAAIAVACSSGSGDQPAATATAPPALAPTPAPSPVPTETPPLSAPTRTPLNSRAETLELLNALARPQLLSRGFELAEIPVEIVQGIIGLTVEEQEAIWTEFLTNTRVEYDGAGTELLLCDGGHATTVRSGRYFELLNEPLTWEVSRSPATRGTDVTLKLTPLDPDIAANRLFYGSYNTPSYTVSMDFQQGSVRFVVNATTVTESISKIETIIVRDPECSSHLPG